MSRTLGVARGDLVLAAPLLLLLLLAWGNEARAQGATTGQRPLTRTRAPWDTLPDARRSPSPRRRVPPEDSAVVDNRSIRLVIPRPIEDDWKTAQSMIGFYAWEIAMRTPTPFTLVLTADTMMRSPVLRDVVGASTVRLCPSAPPVRVRDCVKPIGARVAIDEAAIRVVIYDAAIVTRVRTERPLMYVRSAIAPRGRVDTAEQPLLYLDRRPVGR